jgi:lysophospholipase L1-like esterase
MLAFGDSITFGSDGLCPLGPTSTSWTLAELLRSPFNALAAVARPYPLVLQDMLRNRYTAQSPTVFNAGVAGEFVTESETRRRFSRLLSEQNPEIVLLQEGINDLHVLSFYNIPNSVGYNLVRDALRTLSLDARARGSHVFLATLLPERADGCRAFGVPPKSQEDLISPTNNLIRSMAAAEGIDLVDLYSLFNGRLNDLIGQDGLHPNDAGYSAIANAFFEAIRQKFEKPR